MPTESTEIRYLGRGATRFFKFDFTDDLASADTLTGTPTITQIQGGSTLTLTSKAVNTATYTDAYTSRVVAIGKAITVTVAAASSAKRGQYRLLMSCVTTDGETVTFEARLVVV